MEPFFKGNDCVRGIEVLYFPDAELEKSKGGKTSFGASGPLSVLYFKDYDRFFLRIDDWKYPLMRRLPVYGSGKNELHFSSFCFPASNGFSYKLRINTSGSNLGLENLEAILQENSRFSWEGESHVGKVETSPSDKLSRSVKEKTSFKEVISETFKHGVQNIKTKIETMKTGTKNINSRKKMTDIKTIKNKNFKKSAHSTFKKDFFEQHEKLSLQFNKLRGENLNLTLSKSYEELKKTSDTQAPSLYFPRFEIEGAILDFRDVASKGNFSQPQSQPQPSSRVDERSRNQPLPGQQNISKMQGFEGMTHYEG